MWKEDRDRMTVPLPRPVWWHWHRWIGGDIPDQPPHPAILLEWRMIEKPGRPPRWEGLIVCARGGGEVPWAVELKWVVASELAPIQKA